MKCSKCGAALEAGISFCTSCGTPVPKFSPVDGEKTVLINQDNMGQPQGFPSPAQPGFNPQGGAPAGVQGQPQGMNPYGGQPQGMNPYGQPQGMNPYGQPQGMNPYRQPNMYNQAPRAPRPPRKPLSKQAKIGIISGAVAVVLLIVFFTVILPILTKAKLKGEYSYEDYTIVFDDGTFVWYDYDGDIYYAGTYTMEDDKIQMTDIDGYELSSARFDSDDNKIRYSNETFRSTDKKATLDIKLTEDYLDNLKDRVDEAVNTCLKDDDLFEEAYWNSYYIYGDALSDPDSDFEKALAENLGYSSDKTLQTLIELDYLEFDIYVDSDGTYDISYYVY